VCGCGVVLTNSTTPNCGASGVPVPWYSAGVTDVLLSQISTTRKRFRSLCCKDYGLSKDASLPHLAVKA